MSLIMGSLQFFEDTHFPGVALGYVQREDFHLPSDHVKSTLDNVRFTLSVAPSSNEGRIPPLYSFTEKGEKRHREE